MTEQKQIETPLVTRPLLVDDEGAMAEGVREFALPTGTVTFLLTDVEGSTKHWESDNEATALAVARHYELLDEAVARWGGVRPVEQGEGDSVVAAFSRASDAAAAALDAQRALGAEAWPDGAQLHVRMALHTGEAQLRDAGNYFGQSVIRCARLRECGHGGQVLLSQTTADLIAGRLPEGVSLTDLGSHRLKDLGQPERIWQLVHPDVREDFPPLRSLDAYKHNLPVQLTPLVGRRDELSSLADLVGSERLVTLTGAGGVGKTRLALAAAGAKVEEYPGGVWWIELAGIADPSAAAGTVLAATGGHDDPTRTTSDVIAEHLGDRPALVVLDNCEHLIVACAELAGALLQASPTIAVLATSREPLGVPGEITWRVPSLPAPPPDTPMDISALSQFEAVRLFMDRARRARPNFAVTEENAPAIAQICFRLDGIPLAIELAAARCRTLGPERIASELDQRFKLLTGGARTLLPRQQTLAASVDWSHDLLDESERVTFRRLGVFSGPFPLDAAEAVAGAFDDVDALNVYDLVSRLTDKSLLAVEDDGRFRMSETIRTYALEKAQAVGELSPARDAHAEWWTDWLDALDTDGQIDETFDAIDIAYANLRAALEWSADDGPRALRLARGLGFYWANRSRYHDAVLLGDRAFAHRDDPQAWAAAVARNAMVRWDNEDFDFCEAEVADAGRIAKANGDHLSFALSRTRAYLSQSDDDLEETMRLAGTSGSDYAFVSAALALAGRLRATGRLDKCEHLLSSIDTNDLERRSTTIQCLVAISAVDNAVIRGEVNEATQIIKTIDRPELADPRTHVLVVQRRVIVAQLANDMDATAAAEEGYLPLSSSYQGVEASLLLAAVRRGDPVDGRTVVDAMKLHRTLLTPAGAASVILNMIDHGKDVDTEFVREFFTFTVPPSTDVATSPLSTAYLGWCESILARKAGEIVRADALMHESLALASAHGFGALALLVIEGLAIGAADLGRPSETPRLLGAADTRRARSGYRFRYRTHAEAVDAAIERAKSELGDESYKAGYEEGTCLDWPDAIAYAQRMRGSRSRPTSGWDSLTPTERQVVDLVVEGLTNPQIAERLLMGRSTVKTHLVHVYAKLGISNRTQLAQQATRRVTTATSGDAS